MSDKYYLHDCNSYTHSCQNTYRIERKDILRKIELAEQEKPKKQANAKWWQRLWLRDTQEARA